ncbi:MAG: hypothetical protein ACKVKR_13315, partial [Pseudomonadales bacterium]
YLVKEQSVKELFLLTQQHLNITVPYQNIATTYGLWLMAYGSPRVTSNFFTRERTTIKRNHFNLDFSLTKK